MKLYIGGCGQGQEELARRENPGCEIITGFHTMVREWLKDNADAMDNTATLCDKHPQAVIVSDEIGCGVVPISRDERFWREQTGRSLCMIAGQAEAVVRVICGIGVRIK